MAALKAFTTSWETLQDFGGTMRVALADGDGPATALRRAQASSESGAVSTALSRRQEGVNLCTDRFEVVNSGEEHSSSDRWV